MSRFVNETVTERMHSLLGNPVVLLPIGYGQKNPLSKGWQTTTVADCDTAYLAQLDTGRCNIGVLLGVASGGLCSIDIDDEADIEPFLERNPALRETLRTRGRRGCNLWVRIEGGYPKLTRIKTLDGRYWGEWRADGGQTIIYGRHPEGMDYQVLVERRAISLPFEKIDWGELVVPWTASQGNPADQTTAATPTPESAYKDLVRLHGDPVAYSPNGSVRLNQYFFVGRYSLEHKILHEPAEKQFYEYDESRGLWRRQTIFLVKDQFALDLKAFADLQGLSTIDFMRNNNLLTSLAELLRGRVEKREIFQMRRTYIHLGNGMLHLTGDNPGLHPFSPDYYSRNQCPLDLVPGARCPQFIGLLLESALDADDIDLLQRWTGSLLLGGNLAQRILVLTGTAGGGKSTLLEIVEAILGLTNVHELRTEHLHERFELQFFIGKTLLTGKDVPGDFLQRRGASMLKKLVGNDNLSPERKGGNDVLQIRGNFDVAITANSRLHVRLDGDADAWRRRLMVIRYERPKPKERIADFGQKLLQEEGPGILNWMIQGAIRYLEEIGELGDFRMTDNQRQRVDDLLAESDSVRAFLRTCLEPTVMGDLSTEELIRAYREFCDQKGWDAQSQKQVERTLPDLMMEAFGIVRSHKIERFGRSLRGYAGIQLRSSHEAD
ncbi:MAG: phage/plasmid primase, P4 family [Oceanipulchritudo sp.]